MAKLIISILGLPWLLIFMAIIKHSSSARTLGNPPPPTHHKPHPTTTFFMQNLLTKTKPLWRPATTKVNHQLPFPKPVGFFPPNGGIPLPEPRPNAPATGLPTQALDLSGISLSFPAIATLQELEFGTVLIIDEDLFEGTAVTPSSLLGKAQGVYVASSEDGSSHMMAMTTTFAEGAFKDSLRFFGVLRTDVPESHIAIIGGTGKYDGANGYTTVKAVTAGLNASAEGSEGASKPLLFNVYLS
ncbi:Dirigent protein 10 [Vitis vinifera]|uniref:Dirigent protein n=1 Tax=Vitis vinifera TaxID=29760 RepID=A0A438ENU3_VITVI|nr:Dirigent protein 10 [Vitis vinifera]